MKRIVISFICIIIAIIVFTIITSNKNLNEPQESIEKAEKIEVQWKY